jgi:hypothetical protein
MLVGAPLLENWQNDPCGAMLPTPIEPSILASPMPSDTMVQIMRRGTVQQYTHIIAILGIASCAFRAVDIDDLLNLMSAWGPCP